MSRSTPLPSPSIAIALLALAGTATAQAEWMPSRQISARSQHAMAFDEARQRVVCFGGTPYGSGMTWEWDGTSWTGKWGGVDPGGRGGHAMAYDAARQRIVLFGGRRNPTTLLADTWEWDGSNWTLVPLQPFQAPTAREGHEMAYDAARQRVVLFGGVSGFQLADTWEWDGSVWVNRTPAQSPSSRSGSAMAYDAARGRCVLFGGHDGNNVLGDTWQWDGASWIQQTVSGGPSPRTDAVMSYDSVRQEVLLHSGWATSTLTDTWTWNGTSWTPRAALGPPVRQDTALATDTARNRVVLFGGTDTLGSRRADTWEWDGTSWTLRDAVLAPRAVGGFAAAQDLVRERLCLFGGSFGPAIAETWEWDGMAWARRQPAVSPSPRSGHAMAYDLARQRVVLFGGGSGPNPFADTWLWDGTNWSQQAPTTSPPQRGSAAVVYDSGRQRIVLHGGYYQNYYSDTWEWDGVTWIQRTTPVAPGGRAGHAMAYDLARQRTVLFGGSVVGSGAGGYVGDTWEWDGSTWVQRFPPTGPAARSSHGMAYDMQRQRVVLFGGRTWSGGSISLTDTWEWDGTTWTPLPSPRAPAGGDSLVLAYDARLERIVAFGQGQTWLHGELAEPVASAFGLGCPGSNGVPALSSNEPYLGNPSFRLQLRAVPAGALCSMVLGWSGVVSPGTPGCTLLVTPEVMLLVAADGSGLAESPPIVIPHTPSLRGVVFYAQGIGVDPLGQGGGLSASAGRRFDVGD